MASSTLMRLLVELGVDSTDFMNDMDKAESKAHSTGKGIMKGIGGALGGLATAAGVAMTAVAGALASTIQPASDLAETMSKVRVVFGDAADGLEDWSDTSATALGMSRNEALAAAGTYGNLFSAMGIGAVATADMSVGLVELAADLASFNNSNPQEVLDALRSGLAGETEPLKKLGVNLNQATIEAKALELGLWSGTGALDAATKAQATYALIMEQTSLAQGDFARTADGLANQQRIMAANFENIKATIGAALLPTVNQLTQSFNDLLGGILEIIKGTGSMDEKMFKIGSLVSTFVNNIVSGLPDIITAAGQMVVSIVEGIVKAIPALIPAAVKLLMTLVNGIVTLLPLLLDAAFQIIVQLALGIAQALPTLIPAIVDMMMKIVMVIVENIPLLLDAAVQIIMGLVDGIINALPIIIDQLPVIVMAIITAIINALPLLMTAAMQIIVALVNGILSNLPALIIMAINLVLSVVQAILDSLPMLLDAGIEMVIGIVEGVEAAFVNMVEVGKELMEGFWEGLQSKFAKIWEGVVNFVESIIDKVGEILGIGSPSKVFRGIGENVMLGFAQGIDSLSKLPTEVMLDATGNISGAPNMGGGTESVTTAQTPAYPTAQEIGNALFYALQRGGVV